jgi:hypothetical protein
MDKDSQSVSELRNRALAESGLSQAARLAHALQAAREYRGRLGDGVTATRSTSPTRSAVSTLIRGRC